MFGPQARAAELQAMRSAVIRQQAIPLPAAASLTEFVRPVSSKNKGVKQFKPLSPADLEEDQSNDNLPASFASESPITEAASQLVFVNPPPHRVSAPKAPKAMLNCTPKQIPNNRQVAISYPRQPRNMYYHVSDVFAWMSPSPIALDTYVQWQAPMSDVERSPEHSMLASSYDFLYGNEGYSPTKIEIKLRAQQEMKDRQQSECVSPAKACIAADSTTTKYNPLYSHPDFRRLTYGNALSDIELSAQRSYFNLLKERSDEVGKVNRPGLLHLDLVSVSRNHTQRACNASLDMSGDSFTSYTADYPYDRNMKMQTFVAAQQAMRKTSKTVLNNPEIRKSHARTDPNAGSHTGEIITDRKDTLLVDHCSLLQGPNPEPNPRSDGNIQSVHGQDAILQEKPASQSAPYALRRRDPRECPAIERAMRLRDDLQSPMHDSADTSSSSEMLTSELPDELFMHRLDQIRLLTGESSKTDSWCMLRQISCEDRAKIQKLRSTAAAAMNRTDMWSQTGNHSVIVGAKASLWLLEATVGENAQRQCLERLIDDHLLSFQKNGNQAGVIGQPVGTKAVGLNIELLKALANVMSTMEQYEDDSLTARGCNLWSRKSSNNVAWSASVDTPEDRVLS